MPDMLISGEHEVAGLSFEFSASSEIDEAIRNDLIELLTSHPNARVRSTSNLAQFEGRLAGLSSTKKLYFGHEYSLPRLYSERDNLDVVKTSRGWSVVVSKELADSYSTALFAVEKYGSELIELDSYIERLNAYIVSSAEFDAKLVSEYFTEGSTLLLINESKVAENILLNCIFRRKESVLFLWEVREKYFSGLSAEGVLTCPADDEEYSSVYFVLENGKEWQVSLEN